MDKITIIKETFEAQTGIKVNSIYQFENVENNTVFKVETAAEPYIFKVYSNRDWPEDGKLIFVYKKLNENKIPHAEILVYNRDDANFPNGYIIERCLPGITADRLNLSVDETLSIFKKLALLVSNVHKIKLTNYGYTGDGKPAYWSAFSGFMYDTFNDNIPNLIAHNIFTKAELEAIGHKMYENMKFCDKYPSVICHGDLSAKNILVNSDNITLIDWDDVHSLCWMADIARLTLWMKLEYDKDNANIYRKTFIDNYKTEYDKNDYYKMENTLHIWYGFDNLNYFFGKPQYEKIKNILLKDLGKFNV